MAKKCKPVYKNLNTIQSYSEQKYATVQWCEQNCMNDEWLRQQVEELRYLTPPAVRKRFKISEFINLNEYSYGAIASENGEVNFNNNTSKTVYVDFTESTMHLVDKVESDKHNVRFTTKPSVSVTDGESDEDGDNPVHRCELKVFEHKLPKQYSYYGSFDDDTTHINSYWYVAMDKSKKYNLKADWLKNWKSQSIPAVSRAQTFKAEKGGYLESVDLKLQYNGSKNTVTGSPLYVQLWKTYYRFDRKSTWDRKKRKMIYKKIKYSSLPDKDPKNKWQDKEHYSKYDKYIYAKLAGDKKKEWHKLTDKVQKYITKNKLNITENDWYVYKREKIHWLGHNKKKGKDKNGKNTYYTDIYHPLSEGVFDKTGDTTPTIVFNKPYKLQEGQYYALVFSSPLSYWEHCPRIGGWGRNCKNDKAYTKGYAFLSENNGKTWIRYGKNEEKVKTYKQGKYTPQDYAFRVKVDTSNGQSPVQYTPFEDENYLYLKPIMSNPITHVEIYGTSSGEESTSTGTGKVSVEYQVSTDGNNWTKVENNSSISFQDVYETEGSYPRMLLVRAKLSRSASIPIRDSADAIYQTNEDGEEVISDNIQNDSYRLNTPYIENLTVRLTTLPAKEMYARTSMYTPKTSPMLGANIWGRVFAPFSTEDTVNCTAEIIQGNEYTQHFIFVGVNSVDEYMEKLNSDDKSLSKLDTKLGNNFTEDTIAEVKSLTGVERAQYLTENSEIIEELKKNYIYIKPFTDLDCVYLLSFSNSYESEDMVISKNETTGEYDGFTVGGMSFPNTVAYPILKVRKQDSNSSDGELDIFTEWIDYTFDYENNKLIFKKSTILDSELTTGDIYVTYNPVFIEGLTPDEVGVHYDKDTGLRSDGLILDYFKETINITTEMVENRRVSLRVKPTDPIRQVYLYKYDADEDSEPLNLLEDYNFYIDIDTNELVFEENSSMKDSKISVLDNGDILEVVYTPWLEDDTLGIGYFATRTNTDKQVHIDDVYFEYKA